MEKVRVEEFGESNDKDCGRVNLVLSRVSLSKFSLEVSTFRGYKGIYSSVYEECEKSCFIQTGHSGDLTM